MRNWTKDIPTKEGWWWYQHRTRIMIFYFSETPTEETEVKFPNNGQIRELNDLYGFWSTMSIAAPENDMEDWEWDNS